MKKSKIEKIEKSEKEILTDEIKEFLSSIQSKVRLTVDENIKIHQLYNQYYNMNEKNYNCPSCVNRIYLSLLNIFN